jgi:heme/copper-type cytochrome/quinol oxidase subunit 1
MPRRIPDYPDAYEGWNYISSIGSLISVAATVVFLYLIYDMLAVQPVTTMNPYGTPQYYTSTPEYLSNSANSTSLEWVIPSPTPYHAYLMMPVQS